MSSKQPIRQAQGGQVASQDELKVTSQDSQVEKTEGVKPEDTRDSIIDEKSKARKKKKNRRAVNRRPNKHFATVKRPAGFFFFSPP